MSRFDNADPAPSPDLIRAHLRRVLSVPAFRAHERATAFLAYVVERVVEGRGAEIKQVTIGCELFGRPPAYDPRRDAIVRTVARSVREKLNEYYLTAGAADEVVIEIPKGSYLPVFKMNRPQVLIAPKPRARVPAREGVAFGMLLLALLGFSLAKWRGAVSGKTLPAPESAEDAKAAFETGREQLLRGEYVAARSQFERATANAAGARPHHEAMVYAALASDFSHLGYDGLALAEARKAEAVAGGLRADEELEVEATFRAAAGDHKGAVTALTALVRLSPGRLDLRSSLAHEHLMAGSPGDCLRTIETAHALADAASDSQLAATEAFCRAGAGDYLGALAPARRAAAIAKTRGERENYARARLLEAGLLMSTNHVAESIPVRDEARRICVQIGDDECALRALRIGANLDLAEMRPAQALQSYRAALPLARRMNSLKEVTELLDGEGCALMRTDDFAGANAAFVESLVVAQRSGFRTAGVRQDMTEMALLGGQLDRAAILANETENDARAGGDRVAEAAARIFKARVLVLRGDVTAGGNLLSDVRRTIDEFHLSADIPRRWRVADADLNRVRGQLSASWRDLEAHDELGNTTKDIEYIASRLQLLLALHRYDEASSLASTTLALLEGSGNQSAGVFVTALLSDSYGFSGRLAEARNAAQRATSLLSAQSAPYCRNAALASAARWERTGVFGF